MGITNILESRKNLDGDFSYDETEMQGYLEQIASLESSIAKIANDYLEDSSEGTYSLESNVFVKWLKIFLDKIYQLWDKIIEMIDGIRIQAENRLVKANNLLIRIKNLPDLKRPEVVEFGPLFKWMMVDGRVPSPSDLNKALTNMHKVLRFEANDIIDYTYRIIQRVFPRALEVFEIATNDRLTHEEKTSRMIPVVRSLADSGLLLRKQRMEKSGYKPTQVYDYDLAYESESLVGNSKVVAKLKSVDVGAINETGQPLLSLLDNLYSSRYDLVIDYDKHAGDLKFSALNKSEQISICNECIGILKEIIQFKVRHQRSINAARRDFKTLRDKLVRVSKEDENVDFKLYCRKTSKALHAVTRWLHNPVAAILVQSIRSSNASLEYCYRSQRVIIAQNRE